MRKFLVIASIVLVVLIVVVTLIVSLFLDSIVKKGMETAGPKITRVSVKVDAVNLTLLNGSAKVKGLVVGNPEGYKTPQAISVGSAAVNVNPFTVFSDKIVVRSVRVEAPEITFEGSLGGNNLSKIMDNVNAVAKNSGPASTNAAARAGSEPGRKFEVDDLLIADATIHVSFTGIGAREMTLPLPEIHLTDLGKDGAGITATDLTRRVLGAITAAAIKAVADATTDISKGAGKAMDQNVNKITKSLGGLFKKTTN